MARSPWRSWLACVLSLSLSGCATVKVPAKRYVAMASVSGGEPAKKSSHGRDLPPELHKTGVLWAGDKIAVLPGYPCHSQVREECYREIDELEVALMNAGFWVEPWRELRALRSKNRFSEVKKRGIEHALIVDSYTLKSGGETELKVKEVSLVEQEEAKKPKPLVLGPQDWKVVGPRCVNYFNRNLQEHAAAPKASMSVRLISVSPERVVWTRNFEERTADPQTDLQLIHDVPKSVKNKRKQRLWGLGLAGSGGALGVGTGLGAKNMSTSSTLIMTGVALGLASLGSWLVYQSRPREVYPKKPVELLCKPAFKAKSDDSDKKSEVLASSRFEVESSNSEESPDLNEIAADLQASLVNDVARSVSLLTRSKWEKPKKKKDKKDKKGKKDKNSKSALACVWHERELRCAAACSRCRDPWEGTCEVCRPGQGDEKLADLADANNKPVKVVVVNAKDLKPGKKDKKAKAEESSKESAGVADEANKAKPKKAKKPASDPSAKAAEKAKPKDGKSSKTSKKAKKAPAKKSPATLAR